MDTDNVFEPLVRPVLALLHWFFRSLLYIACELGLRVIGWSVGWYLWRLLTFGHFPSAGLRDEALTSRRISVPVELSGLLALAWLAFGLFSLV